MLKIKKVWIALGQSTEMHVFSRTVLSYFMFNHTCNLFEVPSSKNDGSASSWRADDIGEASVPVRERELVAAEVWKKCSAVDEVMRYVTHPKVKYANSKLIYSALCTELTL